MDKLNRRTFHKTIASWAAISLTPYCFGETGEPLQVAAQKKSTLEWKEYPTRTVARLQGFEAKKRSLNSYGGMANDRTTKTGFWHVEKHGDRFWMVDPEGGLNIHRAVCSVTPGRGERNMKAFQEKFKTREAWGKATDLLLRENGFNGTGAWSDVAALSAADKSLACCLNLNLMSGYGKKRGGTFQKPGHTGYPNDCIFAFDPEFADFCDQSIARQLVPYRDDPSFFGYFTDNEMPFPIKTLDNYFGIDNANDPGRLAAENWLRKRGGNRESIRDVDRWEFLGFLMEQYMSVVSKAIRKHDPHHLILGPRLHGSDRERRTMMKVLGRYTDIVSFNYYGVWTPEEKHTQGWTEWSGKPFMVTEWYSKGEDSGLGNTTGAGWNVKTQKDRGLFYQNYTLALLESRNCVGWHWFKYQDNDPTAKGVDPSNIDSNKGIVDNDFVPYRGLLDSAKEVNAQVFDLIEYFDRKKS